MGNTKAFPLGSGSGGGGGGLTDVLPIVLDNSGAGNGVTTARKSPSIAQSFIEVSGTLPSAAGSVVDGLAVAVTGSGSAAGVRGAITGNLLAGYTGATLTWAVGADNNATAGTGTVGNLYIDGYDAGVFGQAVATTTNARVGVIGRSGGGNANLGVMGNSGTDKAGVLNIGVHGLAFAPSGNAIGGYFSLDSSSTFTSPAITAALLADNHNFPAPIFLARWNGTDVFTIDNGGDIKIYRTITAGGTTGNQVINKAVGTVNIAAAGTAVTVTNSLCVATSLIFLTFRTVDTTAKSAVVVAGAGSFVITLNAAATAEVSIGFMVTN